MRLNTCWILALAIATVAGGLVACGGENSRGPGERARASDLCRRHREDVRALKKRIRREGNTAVRAELKAQSPKQAPVRLLLDRRVVAPGDGLHAAPKNARVMTFNYGLPYKLERLANGKWTDVPLDSASFSAIGLAATAGTVGRCLPVRVPADASPGTYRVELTGVPRPESAPRSLQLPLRTKFRVQE